MVATSEHYQGSRAEVDFAWQRRVGLVGGRIEVRKFAPRACPAEVVPSLRCGTATILLAPAGATTIRIGVNPKVRRAAVKTGVEVYAPFAEVPSGSVDVAMRDHALEHCRDPHATYLGCLRVLSLGGRLALCVSFDALHPRQRYSAVNWTPLLIGNLLAEAGFVRVTISALIHARPPGWAWRDSHLLRRALNPSVLCGRREQPAPCDGLRPEARTRPTAESG